MNTKPTLLPAEPKIAHGKIKRSIPPKRIGLMGSFGTGNLGDAAIQQTMIHHIQKYYPDAQIHGFSLCPEDTEKRHGITTFPMNSFCCDVKANPVWLKGDGKNPIIMILFQIYAKVYSIPDRYRLIRKLLKVFPRSVLEISGWLRAYKNLKGCDLLIVSGGGQLDDYFGGPWRGQPLTLLIWGLFAKLRRVEYLFVSVGAGPIDSSLSRFFIKKALSLASYRSYRDDYSKNYIAKVVGFEEDDPVYPDLAHSLEIVDYQALAAFQKVKMPRTYQRIVGIGPMPYLAPEGLQEPQSPLQLEYLTKLASFISWLIQNQCAILFFTGEAYYDRFIIDDLKEILNKTGVVYSSDQIIENSIQTTDDLMVQLAMTDIVVASRFHGVLLSQLLNKPVMAISYHPKIDLLMADTGQAEYCLQIDNFDVDTLKERFTALEANRDSIKQQLAKRTQEYREALNEQYERLFGNWQS